MSDKDDLQGLWKVETMTSRGNAVGHSDTHWQFDGDRVQKIAPDSVDGGTWATFTVDETADPRRMEATYLLPDRDGVIQERRFKSCYALRGDTLTVGGAAVYGKYPPRIDDTVSVVTILSRFDGERPATRQASGTKPIESATLGTVTWNDNFSHWKARITFAPDQLVSVSFSPADDADKYDLAPCEAFVAWVKESDAAARAYAAQSMIETAEDWETDADYDEAAEDTEDEDEESDEADEEEDEGITEESFAERITLSEITLEADGDANLWYDDDNIFLGHVIVVAVNADRAFTDAQMMG